MPINPTFYSQHGEDIIVFHALASSTGPRFFVEVGMIDGRRFSNTLAFEEIGWHGVCVEPHPDYIDLVRRHRPGSVVVQAAASNRSRIAAPFYANPRGSLSGLSQSSLLSLKDRFGEAAEDFRTVEVPVKTLDEILTSADAPTGMEVVSIDVEGTELDVLEGMDLGHWQPRVVIVEANTQESAVQLQTYMKRFGYRAARKVGPNLFFTRFRSDTSAIRRAPVDCDLIHTRHPLGGPGPDKLVKAPRTFYRRCIDRTKAAVRHVKKRLGWESIGLALDSWSATRARFENQPLLGSEALDGMRVFATSVIRGSTSPELTGFLLELDWASGKVVRKIPVPVDTDRPFWNARGGNRGGRGLFCHGDRLYMATAVSVLIYDRELNQVGELHHPLLVGLHEIFIDDDGIWLTCTLHDLIIKLDWEGHVLDEWWGSKSQLLQKELSFAPRELNLDLSFPPETFERDYEQYCREERLHINTVWKHHEDVYVLCCRRSALVQIRPTEKVIVHDRRLHSPHNGIITPDGRVLINDTQNQIMRMYDVATGCCIKRLATRVYGKARVSSQFAKVGWQRGLWHAYGSVYLAGTSPATVYEVDIDRHVIGRIVRMDDDVRHCIHGLTVTRGF